MYVTLNNNLKNFFSFIKKGPARNSEKIHIWWPSNLSELTPMIFNTGLTHLDSKASVCYLIGNNKWLVNEMSKELFKSVTNFLYKNSADYFLSQFFVSSSQKDLLEHL